jgi:alpha-D-xyloside xylohydrolase
MFGPSLLINPVHEYKKRNREVYLPAGNGWFDLYTGNYVKGGQAITADAPLERMPVYVKEGSIVPVGPDIQYTNEKPADPLTLYIYTGKDADFELYEDEGVNYNYEKGQYTIIPMHYEDATGTLTIGDRKGSFSTMLKNRKLKIVWVRLDQVIDYDGRQVQITIKK